MSRDPFNTQGKPIHNLSGIRKFAYFPLEWMLRIYGSSFRFQHSAECEAILSEEDSAAVIAVWHNQSLIAPFFFAKAWPRESPSCLISASKAAAWEARFFERLQIPVIRGSTTRRSVQSLLTMRRLLKRGRDIALSPDGPSGPLYSFGDGTANLAVRASKPVYLLHFRISRSVRLASWDFHWIPLPFAKITADLRRVSPELLIEQENQSSFLQKEFLEITHDSQHLPSR